MSLIESMKENYKKLVDSHEDGFDEFESGIRSGYLRAISDLEKYIKQSEKVEPTKILEPIHNGFTKTRV